MSRLPITAGTVHLKVALSRALLWLLSLGGAAATHYQPYDDSTLTLTTVGTPDPFVNIFRGRYYLTFTAGDGIDIWSSDSLVDIEASAARRRVWKPPRESDHSADIWAPELHALRGRWYIYYAAASPWEGYGSHRLYVLGGPADMEDPCAGAWEFLGRIGDMPDQWAIDGTVFEVDDQLYLAYSGWPVEEGEGEGEGEGEEEKEKEKEKEDTDTDDEERDEDGDEDVRGNTTITTTTTTKVAYIPGSRQHLFLVRLADPWTADGWPVAVGVPEQPWEMTRDGRGTHAINEGPQWLASPDGRWRGLVYSCGGSWTRDYKMATLRYRGGEPLEPSSWQKARAPLLQTRAHERGGGGDGDGDGGRLLFGPGHGSFLDVGGGNVVAVYHATDGPDDGWGNRRARVQRVAFTEMGPYMGRSFGVEGPAAGLVARLGAGLARRLGRGRTAEAKDLGAFLEARRRENEAAVADEM